MSVNVFAQDKVIFEDDFNHSKKFEKNWFDNSTEEKTGKIEYKKKGGIDNSGCVKISNPERGAIRIMHSLNNLEPGKLYRMSAMMKCVGVKEGRGAVIYLIQMVWSKVGMPLSLFMMIWNGLRFIWTLFQIRKGRQRFVVL